MGVPVLASLLWQRRFAHERIQQVPCGETPLPKVAAVIKARRPCCCGNAGSPTCRQLRFPK